jgi:hypothetical protein
LMEKPEEGSRCWLDPMSVPARLGSVYPAPFGEKLAGREKRALSEMRFGLPSSASIS